MLNNSWMSMFGLSVMVLVGCARAEVSPKAMPSTEPKIYSLPPVRNEGSLYCWQPVRIGAGGFVTGFITHPLNANVRYCRTDVGNAYRWNSREWMPLVVRDGGRGMPAALVEAPTVTGVESICVDPSDTNVVYVALQGNRSADVTKRYPNIPGNIYRSTDGGLTFTAGNLSIPMAPNGPLRAAGERLCVDPLNPAVVYYGSVKSGLWQSCDSGSNWVAVTGSGAPASTSHVLSVHCSLGEGPAENGTHRRSRVVYAVVANRAVHGSVDGGLTWRDLSATNALGGHCLSSTIDSAGALYVVQDRSRNLWRYRKGEWKTFTVKLNQVLGGATVDPRDPARIWVIGIDGSLGRSSDGGATWVSLGGLEFANTFGWLPQPPGWRSNGGIAVARDGRVWIPQGNEGMVSWMPSGVGDTNRPRWIIDSEGIEEFVTHDVIMPPRGKMVVAVEDATGIVVDDATKYTAKQIPLQDQLISNGTGLSYCPNAPSYLAIVTADVNWTHSGRSYSGTSSDGGKTWQPFAALPVDTGTGKPLGQAGSIAISRRGSWGLGSDHLVWLPTGKYPTYYSHDGGRSWQTSVGFPLGNGYWNFSLKQRSLAADPFVPDKFYFQGSWGGGFFVSTDGGKSWQKQDQAGLPIFTHHAQLAVNRAVTNDLWFVDGWDGASKHGLWHSVNGGKTFTKIEAVEYGITLCLGAGRGMAGDVPYCMYVYGKLAASPDWGIFRSTDAGLTWNRVAFYPAGIFDQPTCMAASWDAFAMVVVGFGGNSFVMGTSAP